METIESIRAYYQQQLTETERLLQQVQSMIYRIGTVRLIEMLAGIAFMIYFRDGGWLLMGLIGLLTLIPFLLLVLYHNRLFVRKDYLETKAKVYQQEIAALANDFSAFDDGSAYIDPNHLYTYDLDVYGPHSLFQCLNRTATQPGTHCLVTWLNAHLEQQVPIKRRQEAIEELAADLAFRLEFRIAGLLHKGQVADEQELIIWARQESVFCHHPFYCVLPHIVTVLNVCCLIAVVAGLMPASIWGSIWVCLVACSMLLTGKISKLQAGYGRKLHIMGTYAKLLKLIEQRPMHSRLLTDIQQGASNQWGNASEAITELNRRMHALDQRNNLFMYAILNGCLFWELRQMIGMERWKRMYADTLPHWLQAIGQIDALCSLATFAYNHPDYVKPTLVDAPFCYHGLELGHPLMDRERCVRNDVCLLKKPSFIVVTGANMAGKSTYLRTVGINYLLACIGAPVCAKALELYPSKLITSLRTSDSLNDNESYFFAELKRLKRIIDKLEAGEELFIILDEILKGTNSMDKQKGSYALMQQFIKLRTNGIIATHDLLLGKLAKVYPEEVSNYCFEADITGNELTFSYKMRLGIAQNMNACFLMKRMGIAVID